MGLLNLLSQLLDVLGKFGEYFRRHPFASTGILLASLVCLGAASWVGFLGLQGQRLISGVLGSPPFGWLEPAPAIVLDLTLIDVDGKKRVFGYSAVCHNGEMVAVKVASTESSYVSVFGWDGRRPYPFSDTPIEPVLRPAGTYRDDVRIDQQPGQETIYVVAAINPFSFAGDVEPHLAALRGDQGRKGGDPSHPSLKLPGRFTVHGMSCAHKP